VKRSKKSKRSNRNAGVAHASAAAKRRRPRRAADSRSNEASGSSTEIPQAPRTAMGTLTEPFSKMFNFQRKLLRAGAGVALSAVDNPASQLVKNSVTESLQGGVKKLEEVFDERVAAALERMGMPSAELLHALIAKVAALTEATSVRSKPRKRS
jgi:hypothetical protein